MQNSVRKQIPKNTSRVPSGDPFWEPKSTEIDARRLRKRDFGVKNSIFGGTRFLSVFWIAFFVNFGPKMGSNHSDVWARERQKIEKKLVRLLRRSFLVLVGVSGRVFCRFCIKFETEIIGFASNSTRNLYVFSDRFSITFVIGKAAIGCFRCYVCALPWHKIWNRNQICARWLQEFLGIKSALTRITHPQHPFSKGGGLAKRPQ